MKLQNDNTSTAVGDVYETIEIDDDDDDDVIEIEDDDVNINPQLLIPQPLTHPRNRLKQKKSLTFIRKIQNLIIQMMNCYKIKNFLM